MFSFQLSLWWLQFFRNSAYLFQFRDITFSAKQQTLDSLSFVVQPSSKRTKKKAVQFIIKVASRNLKNYTGQKGKCDFNKENFCFSGINKVKKYFDRKATKRSKYIFMITKNKRRRNLILIMKIFLFYLLIGIKTID